MQLTCDAFAAALPSILDGEQLASPTVVGHVERCLRCQAELARYRLVLRMLHQLRAAGVGLPPGAVTEALDALERTTERTMIRSALAGRRLAYAGAIVAGPAIVVGAALVARAHGGRGRRRPARPPRPAPERAAPPAGPGRASRRPRPPQPRRRREALGRVLS